MNREHVKDAIKVMQAWLDGKVIEYWIHGHDGWGIAKEPTFDWRHCTFRVKEEPTLRPWTADEVPLGAWVRMKNMNNTRSMIVSASALNLEMLFQTYEHSTDGGKTWLPCGVMEESK